MKYLFFNKLHKSLKVIAGVFLLSGCQLTISDTDVSSHNTVSSLAFSPVEITAEMAAAMIEQDPWNYFTDFGDPYACLHSELPPETAEPIGVEPETIWQRIRLGYQLKSHWTVANNRLEAEFNWYFKHPEYMQRVSERAQRYIYHVTEQLEARQLPLELALLPIVESAYDPFAYSHGRASGMWQFIPGTGRMYLLRQDWWYDGRRDVVASTEAAINYLSTLNKYYDGDWLLALAAYNSGQGNVNKAIRKNKRAGKPTDFWSLDLPRETRSYVPKLLALAKLVNNPRRYNFSLYPVPNQPYFAAVDVQSQIDLAQAAAMADIDIQELYLLNPGFNRWATSPKGPHRLLVPVEQQSLFEESLASLPPQKRLHWERYTVSNGDSLLLLAKRFNTGVTTIQQVNNLKGNIIRVGQNLMIPTASKDGSHYALSANQRLTNIQAKRTGGAGTKQVYHQVTEGESLWTISRRYKVRVAQLAHWNGMAPKDVLQPGRKLSVWVSKNTENSALSLQAGQRDSITRKVGYRVRNGDSLARIAGRFNVSVNDIVRWNSVNPKNYLQPGQQLTLYVDVMNAQN